MCGIAGYISKESVHNSAISSMAKTIEHRGPDDEGFVFANLENQKHRTFSSEKSPASVRNNYDVLNEDGIVPAHHLAMAQVRYSIIDLSAHGHQPMWSVCGRYCITFNGEIYNYIELRNQLRAVGRVFHTKSDTEVLLQAYVEWGDKLFEHLNGFFAFAIYDIERKEVLLGRDRLGKAHLYLTQGTEKVYWASEIKALITAGQVDKHAINTASVTDFLIFGRRDRDGTFWDGVLDFPPGHYAWVGRSCKIQPVRYWSMPTDRKSIRDISFNEATTGLRELLIDSLDLRLRADVPIGFELSGGMDSAAMVGLATGAMGRKVQTYTIKFAEAHSDEEPYARSVAQLYPELIEYTVIRPPQEEFWNNADRFVWEQEEPFHSPNLHTSQSMQRLIKDCGAHVVISGAAGDEMLGGYAIDYMAPYLRHLLGTGDISGMLNTIKNSTEFTPFQAIKGLLLDTLISPEQRTIWGKRKTGENGILRKILDQSIWNECENISFLNNNENNFHSRTMANMTHRLMNYWLRSGMKSSYGIPIESRAPFLDYRVVEYCTTLPPEYLIHGGWHKYVLRKAVEPFLPPEVVWRRKKMGFPFPYREWLSKSKKTVIKNINGLECPYIDKLAFLNHYDDLAKLAPISLWRMISLLLWWRRVIDAREILK